MAKESLSGTKPLALPAQGVDWLLCEADGLMIPIVDCKGRKEDKRKNRKIAYHEARLSCSKPKGSTQTRYAATMEGPDELGLAWAAAAKDSGRGLDTKIQMVADGVPWIQKQAEQWLEPERYVVDFYHLCEYLAGAQSSCAQNSRWMTTQKRRLKTNKAHKVIENLAEHIESAEVDEIDAPVRKAHRYLSNRLDHLDYQGALNDEMPIGSGLIESGNKHVIQARLKIAGASWEMHNANNMIHARVIRANGQWYQFWNN